MAFISVYFSLGSNLGDRRENILEALRRMDEALGSHWKSLSSLIETKPVGFSGGKFLNGAVLYRIPAENGLPVDSSGETVSREDRLAFNLLETVKRIEREMGRTDPPAYDGAGNRIYRSRIIDIDILFCGTLRMDTPLLTIPHKGIKERPFVMIPLLEIAKPSLKAAFPEIFD